MEALPDAIDSAALELRLVFAECAHNDYDVEDAYHCARYVVRDDSRGSVLRAGVTVLDSSVGKPAEGVDILVQTVSEDANELNTYATGYAAFR